jgi:hypothetical protein
MTRNYRVIYSETVMRLDVGDDFTIKIVMVQPVASLTLKNVVAGRKYVLMFQQSDTTPVTTFICPQLLNQTPINPQRGSLTVQQFVGLQTGVMVASAAAGYSRIS